MSFCEFVNNLKRYGPSNGRQNFERLCRKYDYKFIIKERDDKFFAKVQTPSLDLFVKFTKDGFSGACHYSFLLNLGNNILLPRLYGMNTWWMIMEYLPYIDISYADDSLIINLLSVIHDIGQLSVPPISKLFIPSIDIVLDKRIYEALIDKLSLQDVSNLSKWRECLQLISPEAAGFDHLILDGQNSVFSHGDISFGNCLLSENKWYLIDWEDCGWRVAGFDFACLCSNAEWKSDTLGNHLFELYNEHIEKYDILRHYELMYLRALNNLCRFVFTSWQNLHCYDPRVMPRLLKYSNSILEMRG